MTALPRRTEPAHDPAAYAPADATTTGPTSAGLDLFVAQLLCARLCHDLMSPAGAIDIGLGLHADSAGGDADALALATEGTREVINRLKLFRLVFGTGAIAAPPASAAEAGRLLARLLGNRGIRLDWQPPAAPLLPPDACDVLRLTVCLILSAADSLPRGGAIVVADTRDRPTLEVHLTARGRPLRLRPDVAAGFTAVAREGLSATNVHAFYARRLAERLGLSLSLAQTAADELTIAADVATTPAVAWIGLPRPAETAAIGCAAIETGRERCPA
jgi:histidine phosphotransferase ChpT